jgi:endonuclease G
VPTAFQAGEAPTLINERVAGKTRELCCSGFAVLYSGVTPTLLWSAEHLTRDRVDAAKALRRRNSFDGIVTAT